MVDKGKCWKISDTDSKGWKKFKRLIKKGLKDPQPRANICFFSLQYAFPSINNTLTKFHSNWLKTHFVALHQSWLFSKSVGCTLWYTNSRVQYRYL